MINDCNLLPPYKKISYFRRPDVESKHYFSKTDDLMYFNDIPEVIDLLNFEYKYGNWRLFIDS